MRVEPDHAVFGCIANMVCENCRAICPLIRCRKSSGKVPAVEKVVAQNQYGRGARKKCLGYHECLRDSLGFRLFGELERKPPVPSVAEEALERGQIVRSRNDQHVTHAREHQCAQRIVDHRLVKNREQLFASRERNRVQAGARAARQQDPTPPRSRHAHKDRCEQLSVPTRAFVPSVCSCTQPAQRLLFPLVLGLLTGA